MNEKVFLKTLNTVRKALLPDEKHSNTSGMSYSDLNREYTGSRSSKVAGWMNDAERTLVLKEVLTPKFDPKSDLVRCAVFWWVAEILKVRNLSIYRARRANLS